MSENERYVAATPAEVFQVLADGWTYSGWVVGASRIRDVDADWPQPGSNIHHSVGVWPVLINDRTTSQACRQPTELELKVRAWPTGSGRAVFTIRPEPGGCTVRLVETTESGPARLIPKRLTDGFLHWRNVETLRRLAFLAERQHPTDED
jgi:hypothetical protein